MNAFLCCATQWRVTATGGLEGRLVRTGLDYAGCAAALRLGRFKAGPRLFRDLRVMEGAALDEWAAQAAERPRRRPGRSAGDSGHG